jgi:hypothetical protein
MNNSPLNAAYGKEEAAGSSPALGSKSLQLSYIRTRCRVVRIGRGNPSESVPDPKMSCK